MLIQELQHHLDVILEALVLSQQLALSPPRGREVPLQGLDVTRLALAVYAGIVA
jgi:hypothetical protein